jgi:N4-gp56 family major capsid protein
VAMPTAASVVSSGLGAYPTVYFDRVAVDTLQSNLALYGGIEHKTMPDRSGVVLQIFDHSKMAANTTAVTEGTPTTGQTVTQNTRQITLSEFADYISISSKVDKTQLIDQGKANAELLGYRGALSVETIISEALDLAANGDAAVRIDRATGNYLTAAVMRQAAFSLRSKDVKPKSNGKFYGVAHSLCIFDLINDSATGGWQDVWKNTDGNKAVGNGIGQMAATVGGVDIIESNAVKSYANWESGSKTAYAAWVIGKDAAFDASLGKTALGEKNFSVSVKDFTSGNSLDPAALIAKACVYHFFYGIAVRPGSINGFRRVRALSSLS